MDFVVRLPLTPIQKTVLNYVISYEGLHGYPPTMQEIQEAAAIRNPGMVFKVLSALEKKGYILRQRYRQRGIMVREGNLQPAQLELF